MWGWLKGIYNAAKTGVVKMAEGSAKTAAVATGKKGGAIKSAGDKAAVRAGAVFDVSAVSVGTIVAGWLAYVGISWTGEKANDATKQLGFLTIVAGLTGIGVAAILLLRKR